MVRACFLPILLTIPLAAAASREDCDRGDKQACHALAEDAYLRAAPSVRNTRSQSTLRDRIDLRNSFAALIDEGLMSLSKAISLDADYSGAKIMMSQLWRLRAEMEDDTSASLRDIETADEWLFKTSKPIRMGVEYQQAHLLKTVEPKYPPLARLARVHGWIRLDVTVGKDGHVLKVDVLTGHPLLVQAAVAAASTDQYRPLLIRGQAVEVITEVLVTFALLN